MDKDQIVELVRQYALIIKDIISFKEIRLYGSWARGTATTDSDIDVAVLVSQNPQDLLDIESQLWGKCRDVDLRIEPLIVVDEDEPTGFRDMVKSTGILVYP